MKILWVLFFLGINIEVQATGHGVGNGGGVVCISGRCMTLQDAGLKISPEFSGVWIPDSAHYSLVEKKVNAQIILPEAIKSQLGYDTFARVNQFRKVDVVDPIRLDEIKKRYLDIANQSGVTIDPATFEVVAISSDNTIQPALTYLLPKFFELAVEEQSSVLFHEGLYRGRATSDLKYILQFESAMHELGLDKASLKPKIDQLILAHKLGLMNKAELMGTMLLLTVLKKTGEHDSDVKISEFGQVAKTPQGSYVLEISPRSLLRLAVFEPRLPYIFSNIVEIPLTSKGAYYDSRHSGLMSVNVRSTGAPRFYDFKEFFVISEPDSIPLILPE